ITVEVADGQGAAEPVFFFGDAFDTRRILMPHVVARGREPAARAVEHVDLSGVDDAVEILPGHTDREIVAAVPIEVACGEGRAERIEALGDAEDTRAVLGPPLVASRVEAVGRAVDDVD